MFKPGVRWVKNFGMSAMVFTAIGISLCFKSGMVEKDWLLWTNKCLYQAYDASADQKLKKWDLAVTDDSFVRLRKTYAKGKQEYYSFNLHNFNDMDYIGNTKAGTLELKTMADDIIVQTRNDRAGDVDSMTTVLDLPVKNMEPERLDSLKEALNYFKGKGL